MRVFYSIYIYIQKKSLESNNRLNKKDKWKTNNRTKIDVSFLSYYRCILNIN